MPCQRRDSRRVGVFCGTAHRIQMQSLHGCRAWLLRPACASAGRWRRSCADRPGKRSVAPRRCVWSSAVARRRTATSRCCWLNASTSGAWGQKRCPWIWPCCRIRGHLSASGHRPAAPQEPSLRHPGAAWRLRRRRSCWRGLRLQEALRRRVPCTSFGVGPVLFPWNPCGARHCSAWRQSTQSGHSMLPRWRGPCGPRTLRSCRRFSHPLPSHWASAF
mmetsp:Transcript_137606/g.325955  ORF Transcript_137606/g.325955 Transcript_137606/m.325955 type:complete len:218 (+) Transcript_137606:72-725(+)